MNEFPHYFKAIPPGCTHVDVYRVLDLFGVIDAPIQHAVKKLLCAGERGSKTMPQDIAEAIATLQRWQHMREEEQPVTDFNLYTSPDVWTSQPAPAAAPERRKAPWPDYAGNEIFEGDVIVHPSGARARVAFDPSATHSPGWSEWRCDYAGDPSSYALAHQIGELGRAVVEKPAAATEDAERAAYLARWKDAPEWAQWLAQDEDGECGWYGSMPSMGAASWHAQPVSSYCRAGDFMLRSFCCEPRPVQGVEG